MSRKRRRYSRRRKHTRVLWTIVVLAVLLIFGAVRQPLRWSSLESTVESVASVMDTGTTTPTAAPADAGTDVGTNAGTAQAATTDTGAVSSAFSLSDVPAYAGAPYVAVNNNVPYFSDSDLTTTSFEQYGDLDSLGRCTTAYASIGQDLMPTEKRGSISSVKPTGWHNAKYDNVDGKYLYNRCHLIGYQLTAENANEKNLIT
ncbi:MAG: DNA/RNA non-specific endonuclease, partial [Chordicoccus sp.]